MSYITRISPTESFSTFNIDGVEMSKSETDFLVQLLKDEKPVKLLELGVAAGGTTTYLLRHMKKDAKLYSVDLSEEYYRNKEKRSGYIADENCTGEELSRRILLLGRDIVWRIDEIGDGIDFCVIDTMHRLPGEVLHFLAILPYLKDGALVILHDIHLNLGASTTTPNSFAAYANTVLFSSVSSSTKYILPGKVRNIGAFRVEPETRERVEDIFHALLQSWMYYPGTDLPEYEIMFQRHYPEECIALFQEAMDKQKKLVAFWQEFNKVKTQFIELRERERERERERASGKFTVKAAFNLLRCRILMAVGPQTSRKHYSEKTDRLLKTTL